MPGSERICGGSCYRQAAHRPGVEGRIDVFRDRGQRESRDSMMETSGLAGSNNRLTVHLTRGAPAGMALNSIAFEPLRKGVRVLQPATRAYTSSALGTPETHRRNVAYYTTSGKRACGFLSSRLCAIRVK